MQFLDSGGMLTKLSIVVPTYNRAELLKHTLRSLSLQELDKKLFEVIVCDDGSSDNTAEVADSYKHLLDIIYLFQDDCGFRPSSTRNMGIQKASGEVCVFLDGGIIADRYSLLEHWNFHLIHGAKTAAIGYIYGLNDNEEIQREMLERFDERDPGSLIRSLQSEEAFGDVREMHYRLHNDMLQTLPAPWVYFWSGHISVPRDKLIGIGMFDEAFDGKWGIEDNDLGYRLHQAGVQIHLLRGAMALHLSHHSHKSHKEMQGRENCTYFHNKYQSKETELFLEHFGLPGFFDLNASLIENSFTSKV